MVLTGDAGALGNSILETPAIDSNTMNVLLYNAYHPIVGGVERLRAFGFGTKETGLRSGDRDREEPYLLPPKEIIDGVPAIGSLLYLPDSLKSAIGTL
jgi:hypothetical protein